MRKVLLFFAFMQLGQLIFAQELVTKKGYPILPQSGDWSIGMHADPLIRYFGNLFTNDENDNNHLQSQVNMVLTGQYVKDSNTAYRLKLRIGLGTGTINNFVDNDEYTGPSPKAKITDTWKHNSTDLSLGAGIKKSRGKGRLRGIYGVELGLGFAGSTDSYSYGNSFASDNAMPTSTTDWFTTDSSGNFIYGPVSSRVRKVKNPQTVSFNCNGFAGAEYFFAPKLSLGVEYGWGLALLVQGESETFSVSDDGNSGKESSVKSGNQSSFRVEVQNAGAITLNLYF